MKLFTLISGLSISFISFSQFTKDSSIFFSFINVSRELNIGAISESEPFLLAYRFPQGLSIGSTFEFRPQHAIFSINSDQILALNDESYKLGTGTKQSLQNNQKYCFALPIYLKVYFSYKPRIFVNFGLTMKSNGDGNLFTGTGMDFKIREGTFLFTKLDLGFRSFVTVPEPSSPNPIYSNTYTTTFAGYLFFSVSFGIKINLLKKE